MSHAATTTSKTPVSAVWVADQGNGTYKNPVLNADYSDPDVVRVGSDYYLTASSFNASPGLPILHSKDLVNWRLIANALPRVPNAMFDTPQHGFGVWAPCFRYHAKQFYIFWGDPDFGIYMIKAPNPAGPWSSPVLVQGGKGLIDPAPFWDDNGQAYLVHAWAGSRAGVNSLLTLHRLSPDGTRLLDEGRNVYSGHDSNHTTEGPKLYKRNGYYYIFAPAGGVATGWQLVLRSKDLYGPYEERVVLDQGKTNINGPHQGAWVTTPNGQEDWFLHFQDRGAYGRVLHLQPMRWKNDWPVIGEDPDSDGKGQPVLTYRKPNVGHTYALGTPPENDEFNSDTLGQQWQWQANARVTWSALLRGQGFLRLFAVPVPKDATNLWPVPNLLLQKFPAADFTATTKVKLTLEWDVWQGKKAGLLIVGNDYAYLAVTKQAEGYRVAQMRCRDAPSGTPEQVVAEQPLPGAEVQLRVQVSGPEATCRFSYSTDDGASFRPIGEPFVAKPDKWTGAKVGLFCAGTQPERRIGGYADVDWFRITP
ncbi:glycoside hydrolase family 43 protein [Hymenobacter jejuensis]|uniref:Glycosyl hydrolase 43 family protein n=1 Tax=Hymenobacter jejuensis TaxID=2502781 RepID=A0A5B8A3F7_9BACT|nr:glycoside hydrolase 43 family protein [Hymenobacter jejuensis]QDA61659.1 glycosyl hydrolase 43 family protein [Hymenobacter jejuensis]